MSPVWSDTMKLLAAPKRLVPTLMVAAPLLLAQYTFSFYKLEALSIGFLMVGWWWVLGPHCWRRGFGVVSSVGASRWAWGFALLLLGLIPAVAGFFLPPLLRHEVGFLVASANVWVVTGLFWVGAWGLGRDVEHEVALLAAEQAQAALAVEAERAQLQALQSHLDPHFLFNTINAIAEWCAADPAIAERALLDLAILLRSLLEGLEHAEWSLGKEVDLVEGLWKLHKVRDPDALTIDVDVDPALRSISLPPLTLLPLGENAAKHGPRKGHHGTLSLRAKRGEHGLEVEVSNPGPLGPARDGGRGLEHVKMRLTLENPSAAVELFEQEGSTVARVRWPLENA